MSRQHQHQGFVYNTLHVCNVLHALYTLAHHPAGQFLFTRLASAMLMGATCWRLLQPLMLWQHVLPRLAC